MHPRAILDKALNRLTAPSRQELERINAWCEERAVPVETYAAAISPELWAEAEAFSRKLRARAASKDLQGYGGPGAFSLLYFLVRHLQPETAIETGVAAGWSTEAILAAMACNGKGVLWSSDLPYFGAEDREVGPCVSPEHRNRWRLFTSGDKANLPRILAQCGAVEFFHYDSDKSHAGRAWAWRAIRPKLAPHAVVIWDDIQDNWHFRDSMEGRVFSFAKKYVGLVER